MEPYHTASQFSRLHITPAVTKPQLRLVQSPPPTLDEIDRRLFHIDNALRDHRLFDGQPATATSPAESGIGSGYDDKTGEILIQTDHETLGRFPYSTSDAVIESWIAQRAATEEVPY